MIQVAVQKKKKSKTKSEKDRKGSPLWMKKQTSCLEGCPHLVVIFNSIAVYVFINETIFSVFTTTVFIYIFHVLHST